MNWVLFIHQLNMYWRPVNEMSAGLMMVAYYLTVNTNDSLHSVFFFFFFSDSSSSHPLHFHDHTASQSQVDGWSQFNKQNVLFALSDPIAHNPQTCVRDNYTACVRIIWKANRGTCEQFCLNTLFADKRTEWKSVLLLRLSHLSFDFVCNRTISKIRLVLCLKKANWIRLYWLNYSHFWSVI